MSSIKLNVDSWKISLIERNRGRMKIIVKLNKDEAEGFKNWTTHVKPEGLPEEEFAKQIFFNGIEYLNMKLQDVAKKILEDQNLRQQLEASGFSLSSLENNIQKQ